MSEISATRPRRTPAARAREQRAAAHGSPSVSARERLLRAALSRFQSDGTLGAALEDIRTDAGVSVGALYHHFADKTALATALYVRLTGEFQEGFAAELRTHADAEDAVRAGVRFYLRWVSANRSAAAFLLGERPSEDAALRERNRAFFAEVTAWWRTHVHYGVLRDLPFDVINALWLGPAQEYTRHWVAGRGKRVPAAVADVLAEAAWQTLKEPHDLL
jgi:AcrR family transcriptional regulator